VFGGFDKCRFWHDSCEYSILPGLLDTQEVVGSSPIPPISQTFVIKRFVVIHLYIILLEKYRAALLETFGGKFRAGKRSNPFYICIGDSQPVQ